MKNLLSKFRGLPSSVQASMIVLFLMWGVLVIFEPFFFGIFTVVGLVLACILRIINYFIMEK